MNLLKSERPMDRDRDEHYVVVVEFEVDTARREEFLDAVVRNAKESLLNEAGCLRFDVLDSPERRGCVLLYEIYEDRSAFAEHMRLPHYQVFEKDVRNLVLSKRVETYIGVSLTASVVLPD